MQFLKGHYIIKLDYGICKSIENYDPDELSTIQPASANAVQNEEYQKIISERNDLQSKIREKTEVIKRLEREKRGIIIELATEKGDAGTKRNADQAIINSLMSANEELNQKIVDQTREIEQAKFHEAALHKKIERLMLNDDSNESENVPECQICCNPFDDDEHATAVSKNCGHIFCLACLKRIQREQGRCSCRKRYQLDDILRIYGNQ